MSGDQSPTPAAPADAMSLDANNHPRKSYRRKYRKIMVKFEERMRESTGLFKDEQRIFDISQRLAEQTDQMLQLLLEVNGSPEVPSSLRYDLKPLGEESTSRSEKHQGEQTVHESLRLGRYDIQKGEKSLHDYEDSRKAIVDTVEFAPTRSYASLSRTTSAPSTAYDASIDPSAPSGAGYLTIRQEEQYLQSLDVFLSGKSPTARAHATNSLGSRTAERTADREREMQLKNPVSVYNWLRKHQPQVFLQDHETSNDKGGKASGSRSSKRTAAREMKQEQDLYDDDGIAKDVEYGSVSRNKRKRNEDKDATFRPKGGKSGHAAKRRKEDSGRRSKRSSMDARIS